MQTIQLFTKLFYIRSFRMAAFILLVVIMKFLFPISTQQFDYLPQSHYQIDSENVDYKTNKGSDFKQLDNGKIRYNTGNNKPIIGKVLFNDFSTPTLKFETNTTCGKCKKSPDIFGVTTLIVVLNSDTLISDTVSFEKPIELTTAVVPGDELLLYIDKAGDDRRDKSYLTIQRFHILSYITPWVIAFFFAFLMWKLARKKLWVLTILSPIILFVLNGIEQDNFGTPTFESNLYYALLLITYFCTSIFITKHLSHIPTIIKVVFQGITFLLLLGLPLWYLIFNIFCGKTVQQTDIWVLFQNNYFDSLTMNGTILSLPYFSIGFSLIALGGIFFYIYEKKTALKGISATHLIAIIALGSALLFVQRTNYPFWEFVTDSFTEYQQEFAQFIKIKRDRKQNLETLDAEFTHTDEQVVFLIGESLFKEHMSLYGYPRETTPLLNALAAYDTNFIAYTNAWSNYSNTMESLSLAITQANQYNRKKYNDSYSIIDVTKKAGLYTSWITNQRLQGKWDNLVATIATDSDELIALNENVGTVKITNNYDEIILEPTIAAIEKSSPLVVAHIEGSHSSYSTRYPRSYKILKGKASEKIFGERASKLFSRDLNHYDNSIRYNDSIVATLIHHLKKSNKPSVFIYMPDHGEEVFRKKRHNRYTTTPEMLSIPFIIWMSPEYVARHPERAETLKTHAARVFTNDLMFQTLLGFLPIKTSIYDSTMDLGSEAYFLTDKKAYTKHRDRKIDDSKNFLYWRKKNRTLLADSLPKEKIVCSNMYTDGSLRWAVRDSIGGVAFTVHEKKSKLLVGNSKKSISYSLKDFASNPDLKQISSMWITKKDSSISTERILKALKKRYRSHKQDTLYISDTGSHFTQYYYADSKYQITQSAPLPLLEDILPSQEVPSIIDTDLSLNNSRLITKLNRKGALSSQQNALIFKCPDYFHK